MVEPTDPTEKILYRIGVLDGKVDGINNRLDKQNGRVASLEQHYIDLPCRVHGEQIENLEKCNDEENQERRQSKYLNSTRRTQIFIAVISVLGTLLVTLATHSIP